MIKEALSVKQPCCVEDTLKLALEALERLLLLAEHEGWEGFDKQYNAITAIKAALEAHKALSTKCVAQPAVAEQHKQEPVMILPDGSAFGVMSFPLPDDHWLYAPNEYRDGAYEPVDLPKPILTHKLRDAVVAAVRYAVRGATMRGQETDFDPDALVQNAVYALCGPYTTPPPVAEPHKRKPLTDEQIEEIAARTLFPVNFARAIEAAHGIKE